MRIKLESRETFRESTAPIRDMFRSVAEQQLKAVQISTIELAEQIMAQNQNQLAVVLVAMGEMLSAHQGVLWARGWMVDDECPLVAIVKGAEKDDGTRDDSQVDEWMLEYFQERLEAHQVFLRDSWPDRREAFDEAFVAANNEQYRSAILTLFPQIEYACQARIGEKFFAHRTPKGGKPPISRAYEKLKSNPTKISRVLEVLSEYSPLYCSEDKAVPGIVNRHQVVHGNDDTFGTELNYFRCISIAVFLTQYANLDGK